MSATVFAGTARFELRHLLGRGGMGLVYAAYDLEHRCEVALKLLPSLGPAAADRLKREFRVARGTHHRNLVSLGELIEEDGNLFFTMELVDGVDWLSYVRGLDASARPDHAGSGTHLQSQTLSSSLTESSRAVSRALVAPSEPYSPLDLARLRSALQQLAEGLAYLHRLGKVHRDVKPSNILVTGEGRVVLLDFGLTVDRGVNLSEACRMHLVGRAHRQWRGDLGRGLVGVKRPTRWLQMLIPGLSRLEA